MRNIFKINIWVLLLYSQLLAKPWHYSAGKFEQIYLRSEKMKFNWEGRCKGEIFYYNYTFHANVTCMNRNKIKLLIVSNYFKPSCTPEYPPMYILEFSELEVKLITYFYRFLPKWFQMYLCVKYAIYCYTCLFWSAKQKKETKWVSLYF